MKLADLFPVDSPIIGGIPLLPLPGSPRYEGKLERIVEIALEDAAALQAGGVDGLCIENMGDAPFPKDQAAPETVASMGRVLSELRRQTSLPVGVNVLRNCARDALAVAAVCGGDFIRVNVLSEAFVTDQGIVEGAAADLMRARRLIGAEHVAVFADVHVKHAVPLLPRPIRESALDLVERAMADVLIVSGPRTGQPPSAEDLAAVRGVADVLIGSGLTPDNAEALLPGADGAIVGTWFRQEGDLRHRVDPERVRAFMVAVGRIRGRSGRVPGYPQPGSQTR
jgi:membrane complex biogenesis BtpA family protein